MSIIKYLYFLNAMSSQTRCWFIGVKTNLDHCLSSGNNHKLTAQPHPLCNIDFDWISWQDSRKLNDVTLCLKTLLSHGM